MHTCNNVLIIVFRFQYFHINCIESVTCATTVAMKHFTDFRHYVYVYRPTIERPRTIVVYPIIKVGKLAEMHKKAIKVGHTL